MSCYFVILTLTLTMSIAFMFNDNKDSYSYSYNTIHIYPFLALLVPIYTVATQYALVADLTHQLYWGLLIL